MALFNHLGVQELEHVVRAELTRVAGLLHLQFNKRVTFDDLLPLTLVLREGAKVDARTLGSQTGTFLKTELFKFCQLYKPERLEEAFQGVDEIRFALEDPVRQPSRSRRRKTSDDSGADPNSGESGYGKNRAAGGLVPDVRDLFQPQQAPRIMFIADRNLTELYRETIAEVDWHVANAVVDALEVLADQEVDMILLDLSIGRSIAGPCMTMQFDHVPAAARGLDQGQGLLRKIRARLPNVPVYLLSLAESDSEESAEGSVDEELFLACVRGGGARGMIVSGFVNGLAKGWEAQRDRLKARLLETCGRLHRQRMAEGMGQDRKILSFDTAPHVDHDERRLTIRLRNLRFARAIAAADAGEVVEDVERPRTRFDDVIGADGAKEELKFFIDYLKNPRRFAALGLKPPKGVLLHGPPGTGKTMLARAMAGESDVAFLSASGSTFVTIWQGSGPQNVRDLFARARRYAPPIIFIDEIDAIGRVRTGGAGGAQATKDTLNS